MVNWAKETEGGGDGLGIKSQQTGSIASISSSASVALQKKVNPENAVLVTDFGGYNNSGATYKSVSLSTNISANGESVTFQHSGGNNHIVGAYFWVIEFSDVEIIQTGTAAGSSTGTNVPVQPVPVDRTLLFSSVISKGDATDHVSGFGFLIGFNGAGDTITHLTAHSPADYNTATGKYYLVTLKG